VTAAFARRSPAAVAIALGTVYLVWGSTYLAIRVTDRTLPPLLMSSVRFLIAGAALYAFASRGRARPTRREWLAAAIVGAALLLVGNGGVAWAETRLDSGFAALIVAIIPLYVALFDRAFFGRRLSTAAVVGLVIGFAGVALLVRPGGGTNVGVALALVATTSAWAAGSLYARGAPLPSSPLLSAAMQMLAAERLPRHRRARVRRGERRARELVHDQAADRLRLPRRRRFADRLLRVRLAAEERPHLDGRDVRVRQSGRRRRPGDRVPRRDHRLVDDRRRRRDRHRRRPDRDGEAALP
jgi:hypothetical protein